MTVRPATLQDVDALRAMYGAVAATPGGLARLEDEIDRAYVLGVVNSALAGGLCLIAQGEQGLVGAIHARSPGLFAFAHVLTDLTIAVHPRAQGQGVGRQLFERFQAAVRDRGDITRVELLTRESNARAIAFYESLGFEREGTFRERIRNVDGTLEADVPMAWILR